MKKFNKKVTLQSLLFWPLVSFLLVLSVASSVYWLRSNNLKMVELKKAVYTADEQNGDIEASLNKLRQFVYGHMNTDLRGPNSGDEPPIQLVYRFNRAVAAEQARVAALGDGNKVYIDAQNQCETASIPLTERAKCIQDYVTQNGAGLPQLILPPKELYTYDFASPFWSPDLAGISILVSLFILLIIAGRLISTAIAKWVINNK